MKKASSQDAQDEKQRPEVAGSGTRLGKLFALRQALANGTYKISSNEVAAKVMEDMLRER